MNRVKFITQPPITDLFHVGQIIKKKTESSIKYWPAGYGAWPKTMVINRIKADRQQGNNIYISCVGEGIGDNNSFYIETLQAFYE